jgi:hypothetical protein
MASMIENLEDLGAQIADRAKEARLPILGPVSTDTGYGGAPVLTFWSGDRGHRSGPMRRSRVLIEVVDRGSESGARVDESRKSTRPGAPPRDSRLRKIAASPPDLGGRGRASMNDALIPHHPQGRGEGLPAAPRPPPASRPRRRRWVGRDRRHRAFERRRNSRWFRRTRESILRRTEPRRGATFRSAFTRRAPARPGVRAVLIPVRSSTLSSRPSQRRASAWRVSIARRAAGSRMRDNGRQSGRALDGVKFQLTSSLFDRQFPCPLQDFGVKHLRHDVSTVV